MDKPEALRLADELSMSHLSYHINHAAAAELRRLHVQRDLLHKAAIKTLAAWDTGCLGCLGGPLDKEMEALRDVLMQMETQA